MKTGKEETRITQMNANSNRHGWGKEIEQKQTEGTEPSGAWNQYGKWSAGVLEWWSIVGGGCRNRRTRRASAELCGKKCGFFRDVSRKFAQNRAVIPRCYALLRVRPFFVRKGLTTDGHRWARIWGCRWICLGNGGKTRRKTVDFSLLFPRFPASSHLFPLKFFPAGKLETE
jgi:hypothetical protein